MRAATTHGPRTGTLNGLKTRASQWWIASETENSTVIVLYFVTPPERFCRIGVNSMGEITMQRWFYPVDGQ